MYLQQDFAIAEELSSNVLELDQTARLSRTEIVMAGVNERLAGTSAADLLPFVPLSGDHQERDDVTTYFRSSNVPTGKDGALIIGLDQLDDFSTAEAICAIARQAVQFRIELHSTREGEPKPGGCVDGFELVSGFNVIREIDTAEARRIAAEFFATCPLLFRVNEIGYVMEDGELGLIADFWALDDRLQLTRQRRLAPNNESLLGTLENAYRWHAYRYGVMQERHKQGCDLLIDACAEAAIAWAGFELAEVVQELQREPWLTTELRNQDRVVACAELYIADGVLTANIRSTHCDVIVEDAQDASSHSRNRTWQLTGTELVARESLSCSDCLRSSGLRALPAEMLANIIAADEAVHASGERRQTGEVYRLDLPLSRKPVFFDEDGLRAAA
ncbi:hypothetical protein [Porphyrobacter sp. GA68]|uniref:hypothetical protein n=1 Tax=Porphyrobacter sp. GA68 TaxID=2883480 RepID=UPI001D190A2A|nr:hypothetical protein [Porphyrobacter sp. GA68]